MKPLHRLHEPPILKTLKVPSMKELLAVIDAKLAEAETARTGGGTKT